MLDLFSGIGGISLAAMWAGIETVAFCEIEPYCQQVLKKHWPHIPIYDDVRTLTRERLKKDGVIDDERTIDIVAGGYPCQPFSTASNGAGCQKCYTSTIAGETGYSSWCSFAEHLAHTEDYLALWWNWELSDDEEGGRNRRNYNGRTEENDGWKWGATESGLGGVLDGFSDWLDENKWPALLGQPQYDWEPPRVAEGVENRVPRLKALGNAVVPQQVYPFFVAIKHVHYAFR
jgi:hypothetical protein